MFLFVQGQKNFQSAVNHSINLLKTDDKRRLQAFIRPRAGNPHSLFEVRQELLFRREIEPTFKNTEVDLKSGCGMAIGILSAQLNAAKENLEKTTNFFGKESNEWKVTEIK